MLLKRRTGLGKKRYEDTVLSLKGNVKLIGLLLNISYVRTDYGDNMCFYLSETCRRKHVKSCHSRCLCRSLGHFDDMSMLLYISVSIQYVSTCPLQWLWVKVMLDFLSFLQTCRSDLCSPITSLIFCFILSKVNKYVSPSFSTTASIF